MRGEYLSGICESFDGQGSPPLARGILVPEISQRPLARITPACAGNTHIMLPSGIIRWDHPRLRGEYFIDDYDTMCDEGSPPLARGIRNRNSTVLPSMRITPACAGNTLFCRFHSPTCKDHPRLRGEYYATDFGYLPYTGSPPLARGIQATIMYHWQFAGITPACAGNTTIVIFCKVYIRDHPRLRGEY